MNSDLVLAIVLQFLGVGVIIAEFILPSAGLLTVTAIAAFGYSVFHVFWNVSREAGIAFMAADVLLIPAAVVIGMKMISKSPAALKKTLTSENGVTTQDSYLQVLVGKTGKALTTLRPAGKALIDGMRLDVVSTGDYIEKNSEIVVSDVSGNRIVVKELRIEN
jgi:membrane-bound serine protease (ClpP class)